MFWEGVLFSIRNPLKSQKRFNESMDLVLNLVALSRPIKPGNLGLLSKPSHLTLGISPSITLDYTNGFFPEDTGIEFLDHVSVSNGFEWLRRRRNSAREQLADLLFQ